MPGLMEGDDRVIRNAGWLYFRLAVTTVADLLAVRLVMKALGVSGYGLFAAVYGLTSVANLLRGVVQGTAQRFLCFELGKERDSDVRTVFSAALGLVAVLALAVAGLAETGGLWFVRCVMSVPEGLSGTAESAFHLCVAIVVLRFLRVPFAALVIARERMRFFARISIVEAAFVLGTATALTRVPGAGIAFYACGLLIADAVLLALFAAFARRIEPDIGFIPRFGCGGFREQGAFLSWSLLSPVANMLKYEGVNMLVNVFAGAPFNASWRLAMKVGSAANGFVGEYLQAAYPRIVKACAGGVADRFVLRIARTLRWSVAFMTLCAVPGLLFAPEILDFWIGGELPPQAVAFTRCALVHFLLDSFSSPLTVAINATGRIVHYQIGVSLAMGSGFALAWAFLVRGLPPWTAFGAVALTSALALAYRIVYLKGRIGLPVGRIFAVAFLPGVRL